MRIVAGVHRSRKLKTLEGNDTRPTLDKIKEAIFSSIGPYFTDGNMLDLFAGSGSMGLESISRGMTQAYFSDCNKEAIEVIQNNVKSLKEEDRCIIKQLDYKQMLKEYKDMSFSFIFIDPPYALNVHDNILVFIEANHMLSEDGVVVVESDKDTNLLLSYQSLKKVKEKVYGKTKITYYRKEHHS